MVVWLRCVALNLVNLAAFVLDSFSSHVSVKSNTALTILFGSANPRLLIILKMMVMLLIDISLVFHLRFGRKSSPTLSVGYCNLFSQKSRILTTLLKSCENAKSSAQLWFLKSCMSFSKLVGWASGWTFQQHRLKAMRSHWRESHHYHHEHEFSGNI